MDLLFIRLVRIHSSVAMSVTQHRLNSVQPNASTVSVWRHLLRMISSYRTRAGHLPHDIPRDRWLPGAVPAAPRVMHEPGAHALCIGGISAQVDGH